MKKILCTNGENCATVPLRFALGAVFLFHGSQKLLGWSGGPGLEGTAKFFEAGGFSPAYFWAVLAACGEFFGGLLVLIGLLTRVGALLIAVTMAVAVFKVHWAHGFSAQKQGYEYPLTLLLVSISLLMSGGGRASLDALICGKGKTETKTEPDKT